MLRYIILIDTFKILCRCFFSQTVAFFRSVRPMSTASSSVLPQQTLSLLASAIRYSWYNLAVLLICHGFNPNQHDSCDVTEDLLKSGCALGGSVHCTLLLALVAAGYRFKPYEINVYDRISKTRPPSQRLTAEQQLSFMSWLEDLNLASLLPTLKQLCRSAIRKRLRICLKSRSILNSIRVLYMPKSIMEYLCLREFEDWTKVDRPKAITLTGGSHIWTLQ